MTTLTYRSLAGWLAQQYELTHADAAPGFDIGRADDQRVADQPGRQIILIRGTGPGLYLEGTFDRVMWSADVAGEQGDYDGAEQLALWLDATLLSLDHSQTVGVDGTRVLCFNRAGGGPSVLDMDDGERWHLTCSYIGQVESGL